MVKVILIFHGPFGKSKEGYEHYEKTGEGLCLVDSCNGKCKK